ASALDMHLDSEIRTTTLGHVQRGGSPTAFDRNLATLYGTYAAHLVATQSYDRMVALQDGRLTSVLLTDVADKTKTVTPEDPMVKAAKAVGTSFGV
ncbi:MAG: 6-phosphofructokinase, partial [Bacteroidota bacterium]